MFFQIDHIIRAWFRSWIDNIYYSLIQINLNNFHCEEKSNQQRSAAAAAQRLFTLELQE